MAHILYLEWNSYAGKFITSAWTQNNDTYVIYEIDTRENTRFGEKITKEIVMKLMSEKFDYMFSFNYFPVAAMAAQACRVNYVSYVYDNPYSLLYSKTVSLNTNHIFLFDSEEVNKLKALGIDTVEYLPLASDADYYQKLPKLLDSQIAEYSSDISFVGSLYIEEKQRLYKKLSVLDEYTLGYLDAMIDFQKRLYGVNCLEEMITPKLLDKMQKAAPLMEHLDAFASKEWTYANYYLYREVTARERLELISLLSEYDIKIYTGKEAGDLLKQDAYKNHMNKICSKVDYYTEAPYVFQNSKINLNITLKSISSGIPLRVFDIMANGGFLLTNYQSDMLELFEPDVDFVYYTDKEDFLYKIDYYLSHDEERKAIARNGYEKVKARHNYYDRLNNFIF